jgi:hypothetical protein
MIGKMEETRNVNRILSGKNLLERPRRKWKDNNKMSLREIM